MINKLHQIQNWPELASKARWSVKTLAEHCGVTLRSLERHFQKKMGKSPKKWLAEHRQLHALEILQKSSCIKEAASNLGYKHPNQFSRDFKVRWGNCPSETISRQQQNP